MALKTAARGLIPPFIAMDVMRDANRREAAGDETLHLEVGQPASQAPQKVRDAAREALDSDLIGYTDALGIAPLRAGIAAHYKERYGVAVPEERVVVTTGSSGGFVLAFLAAFEPGDRVALAAPGYPAYRNILTALGIEVVSLPVDERTRFQPTAAMVRELRSGIDGLIVASPGNPTGTMLDPAELCALAAHCDEAGIRLISDEIYHGITYGTVAESTAAAFSEHAFVINSFSKYYSMTGWRIGWMIVPEDLVRSIECLAQSLYISPPALSQRAAVVAFSCRDELDANVARYAENRRLLLERLPEARITEHAAADGAFYLYAHVAHLTNDSHDFCRRMLAETGVAATPGIDFDPERGHAYVRFSFARSPAEIARACDRLRDWLA